MVGLDANIVNYLVEHNPVREPKATARLTALLAAGEQLTTSDATRLECLVQPFRSGDAGVLSDYATFFASPLIQMQPVTVAVWERAARIRATYNLQALDSIHLATAIVHGCGLFLTADAQMSRCTDITVEALT
jgi:predicted nucleic acid-binding protein